jgi:SSS family solute:Na+ symporter
MKGVMTLSAIQTPILIIGSFLVLFLGLSALGDGNIATGWTEMMDHARSAMNIGADGHAYGANHMFHWTEADPMYQDYPGLSELLSSVSGIGVPTSISYSVYLDNVKAKIMM